MKKLAIALALAALLMPMNAFADDFNGIEVEIPSDWQLVTETIEDDTTYRFYKYGEEMIIISAYDMSASAETLGESFLNNCLLNMAEAFLDNREGFYMAQQEDMIGEQAFRLDECVYSDEERWWHAVGGSRNTGTQIFSIGYACPSLSVPEAFGDFCLLLNDYIYYE